MNKIVAICMLLALFVSGCVTGTYHPTKPRSEWAKDHRECEREVRDIIRDDPDMYDVGFDRGYEISYRTEEQRMIKMCMQRKGWTSKKK
jgi:hypothetical protein